MWNILSFIFSINRNEKYTIIRILGIKITLKKNVKEIHTIEIKRLDDFLINSIESNLRETRRIQNETNLNIDNILSELSSLKKEIETLKKGIK